MYETDATTKTPYQYLLLFILFSFVYNNGDISIDR